MRGSVCALLALCLLAAPSARAETRVYTFPYDEPPQELTNTAYVVPPQASAAALTFAGDCTLGVEYAQRGAARSLPRVVAREGAAYPLREISPFFAQDDLTVVNLEGVLSDRSVSPADKTYRFLGPTALTEVLTLGGVECVGLANNHAMDYYRYGKDDTIAALNAAGIAYYDDETVTVLVKDGVRIGLTGTVFGPSEAQLAQVARQGEALRALGCAYWIHTIHMGTEYAKTLHSSQIKMTSALSALGVDLVVGAHPHIVQGAALSGDTPVVYSLGNFCFGGNFNPPDHDACLLRVELTFADGQLTGRALRLYPISVSGHDAYNDYQPRRLSGNDAERVLDKMRAMSDVQIGPYDELGGALIALPDTPRSDQ